MSAWCESKGLEGSAAFLKDHAAEEMDHMQKLYDYVSECGAIKSIIDKMNIIGTEGRGLYHFDQVVGRMVGSAG